MKTSLRFLRKVHVARCTYSTVAENVKESLSYGEKIQAWQVHSYGGVEELKLTNVKMPIISRQNQVLVQVEATSVNPIDVAMLNGYGATTINLMRKTKNLEMAKLFENTIEFPMTMGRDFAGTVVSKGHGVGEKLQIGDQVWGVVPITEQGCHATHVVVEDSLVHPKPKVLSCTEAASIPYAGLTAWSALWITGGLSYKQLLQTTMNKSVLVLGGSGGVGTIAVQLLKAWNMRVITTCKNDAKEMLEKLRADVVIDYEQENADSWIKSEGVYDIILDCAKQGPDLVKSKGYPFDTYITLNAPLLKNIDTYGLLAGSVRNFGDLIKHNLPKSKNLSTVRWAFFMPCESGIQCLQELVEKQKLVPVIDKVYSFNELPEAYKRVSEGHLRGKVVVEMKR